MTYTADEIDALFLTEEKKDDEITLSTLKTYTQNLKTLNPHLETQLTDLQAIQNKLEIDLFKLSKLSTELKDIQSLNNKYETEIKNRERFCSVLSELLRILEIDERYFGYFENDNFDDELVLSRIEESLCRFDDVLGEGGSGEGYSVRDFDLRAVREVSGRIKETKEMFFKKFERFFIRKLGTFKSKSKGELKIHKEIYGEIFKFKNLLSHDLIQIYVRSAKKLYSKEFRYHLDSVFDILRRKKNLTLSVNLTVIFQSLLLIRECECDFVRKISDFGDENDRGGSRDLRVMNSSSNFEEVEVFDDVVTMILAFLNDLYELDRFQTVMALGDAIGHLQEKTKAELKNEFFEKFSERVANNYRGLKKDFVKHAVAKYRGEHKKKTLLFFNSIILCTKDEDLREKIVHYHTKLILKLTRGSSSDFRFALKKFEFLYPVREHTDFYSVLLEEMKKIILNDTFAEELDLGRIKKNIAYVKDIDDRGIREAAMKIFKEVTKENTSDEEYRKVMRYF